MLRSKSRTRAARRPTEWDASGWCAAPARSPQAFPRWRRDSGRASNHRAAGKAEEIEEEAHGGKHHGNAQTDECELAHPATAFGKDDGDAGDDDRDDGGSPRDWSC